MQVPAVIRDQDKFLIMFRPDLIVSATLLPSHQVVLSYTPPMGVTNTVLRLLLTTATLHLAGFLINKSASIEMTSEMVERLIGSDGHTTRLSEVIIKFVPPKLTINIDIKPETDDEKIIGAILMMFARKQIDETVVAANANAKRQLAH